MRKASLQDRFNLPNQNSVAGRIAAQVAFSEVKSGYSGPFQFPAGVQTEASRANVASHFERRD